MEIKNLTIFIIIIIIMFMKGYACLLFLNPQDEVGPSFSSSVVLYSFVFLLIFNTCFGILFVSILCMCCSHFFWYCFISFTMFCAPVFSLML